MDLLGLVKDQLTSAAVGKIGDFIGESPEQTSSAMGSVLPMILGGLMQKGATTEGASDIMNLIKKDGHDGGILDNLSGLLGNSDNMSGLLSAGSGILGMIFGDKIGGIAGLISSVAGVKSSSASSLLSLAGPLLMGVLGKQVSSTGLGVSGLANLLMGQKDAVKAALPAGAEKFLDMAGLGDFLGSKKTETTTTKVVQEDDSNGGGFNFMPWLLAGAIGLGALYYFKSCRKPAVTDAIAVTDSTAIAVRDTLSSALDGLKKKLSTGVELSFGNASIENEVIGFIEDASKAADKTTWFNFRGLQFDTGKTEIKAESMKEVENIAEILKAYPNVNLKIGGYTDNVGKEVSNQKLSAARANTVMAAIVAKGIDAARLEAEGYGSQFPAATNETEEGRAQNRRIAVRVTKK